MYPDLLIVTESDYEGLCRLRLPAPLQHELDRAIVISDEALPPDVVAIHSRVRYTDETTGDRLGFPGRQAPLAACGAGGRAACARRRSRMRGKGARQVSAD